MTYVFGSWRRLLEGRDCVDLFHYKKNWRTFVNMVVKFMLNEIWIIVSCLKENTATHIWVVTLQHQVKGKGTDWQSIKKRTCKYYFILEVCWGIFISESNFETDNNLWLYTTNILLSTATISVNSETAEFLTKTLEIFI